MNDIFNKIIIAQVVDKSKHPNADKLYIANIKVGNGVQNVGNDENISSIVQIVTGADNFEVGDFVAFLPSGCVVPGWYYKSGEKVVIGSKKIRGIVSNGMILAEDEIGISDDHSKIFILNKPNNYLDHQIDFTDFLGKPLGIVLNQDILRKLSEFKESPEAVDKKLNVIKRDLDELIGEDDLKGILKTRNLRVYWGTAPTGKPSIGYFLPMIKIADLLKIGSEVTILLANLHAYLDNMKSSWDVLEYRTEYYRLLIKTILQRLKAPIDRLKFVIGTDFQLTPDYTLDMYKIATITTVASVKGAGAEVVKQVDNPVLGGMLYPILQALDEEYLHVDAQLGGIDQRKIFMFAREYLPKLGYEKRIHMMHKLIPGLGKSGKMSSSEPDSKVDFDDTDEVIKDKINKAYSLDGQVEGNALLLILRHILFYVFDLDNKNFIVERPEKWGGDVVYKNYEDLEKDFMNKKLSSVDLKPALAKEIINLITPIRDVLYKNIDLINKAYK